MFRKLLLTFCLFLYFCPYAFCTEETETWTSLIKSSDFDGIKADVTTTCVGILSVLLIILALALLTRAFTR